VGGAGCWTGCTVGCMGETSGWFGGTRGWMGGPGGRVGETVGGNPDTSMAPLPIGYTCMGYT
jgi:hypothetical protein